jgi:hypothetical protein
MNKNQFFIVGAQRSGTTYLYNILEQHPKICMAKPTKPEPKYFLNKELNDVNLDEYYLKYYSNCSNDNIFGEKSTSYYENENVAKLIFKCFPNAKILFCLRNPVERALSNYYFSVNNNLEKRSLEEVFIEEKKISYNINTTSVNPFDYLKRGIYIDFIKMYLKYFNKNQIYIAIFDDLINNLDEIRSIYDFLSVDKKFIPSSIQQVVNASSKDLCPDRKVLDFLKKYYKKHNQELKMIIQKDLSW